MKQSEKAAVEAFVEKRQTEICNAFEDAKANAMQRAKLEAETWLSVHRYEMIQGAPFEVLIKFQEKLLEGYRLVGQHEKFWPEAMPGYLSIPLVVPAKKLQQHAEEVRQQVCSEQLAIAEANYRSAMAALEAEALDYLICTRAQLAEKADADAIRALLGD